MVVGIYIMIQRPLSVFFCSSFEKSEQKPTFALGVGSMFVFEESDSPSYQNLFDDTAFHLKHKHIDLGGWKLDDPALVHLTNITRSWKSLMNAVFVGLTSK